jgi:hypothetical protein
MKLTHDELEFLSAWAREEWEPACYQLPCHRLQLLHGVFGAQFVALIKIWTEGQGKMDREILGAAEGSQPSWPWPAAEVFAARYEEAVRWHTHRGEEQKASGILS